MALSEGDPAVAYAPSRLCRLLITDVRGGKTFLVVASSSARQGFPCPGILSFPERRPRSWTSQLTLMPVLHRCPPCDPSGYEDHGGEHSFHPFNFSRPGVGAGFPPWSNLRAAENCGIRLSDVLLSTRQHFSQVTTQHFLGAFCHQELPA